MPKCINTIRFICRQGIPKGKKVTYKCLVESLKLHKKEVHQVGVTMEDNKLPYAGITDTQQASLTTTKFLINGMLSTKNDKFVSVSIKNY